MAESIRATIKNGAICPLMPVPSNWKEGTELSIHVIQIPQTPEEIDQTFRELEALCAENDPEEDRLLTESIQKMHDDEKAMHRWLERRWARERAGLPPIDDHEG